MENVKPIRIVGFIAICIAFLAIIAAVFPKGGIFLYTEERKVHDEGNKDSVAIDSIRLKFPSIQSFFTIDTTHQYADIEGILNYKVDSNLLKELNSTQDSLEAFRKISASNPGKIHYPGNNKQVLHSFFDALEKAEEKNGSVRILHYGDSQIEMDRITSYIREQLQIKFGGSGPGFQPAVQVIPNISTRQTTSGNFVRYASWGFDDNKADHGRYGPMLNFCELNGSGSVSFTPSHMAYSKAQLINNVKVLVGSLESPLSVTLRGDGVSYSTKTAPAGNGIQMLEWDITTFPKTISVSFSGGGTPEIYGIALDGKTGVSVDNLPMRGCSGTIFKRTNSTILSNSYKLLNVKLLILEFGGNMMPSINGPKTAENYGKNFYEQIMYLKQQKPDMDILVIGPADMSKRINGSMQSYPDLPIVVEHLKKAAFDAGGAYWDTYSVMGGHNSMPTWVEQGLAGKDYIHFSTDGAKKISELFYEALMNDYNEYRLEKSIRKLNGLPETDTISVKVDTAKTTTTTTASTPSQEKGKRLKKVKGTKVMASKPIIHIVKSGETLWEIAQKYDVSIENIMADNNLETDQLDLDQKLKIIKRKK